MALDILNETTTSEAITDTTNRFAVASTANITAGTHVLGIMGTAGFEFAKVQAIPVSGEVQVQRGFHGTRAVAHKSGTRVFIGTPDQFQTVPESSFSKYVGLVGTPGNFPDYALPGARARDGAGNEYVLVELTATAFSGTTVRISTDGTFTAAQLAVGDQGSVGLLVEPGTSDQYVWAQIYGFNSYAQDTLGDSSGTSTRLALAATAASTPSVGMAATSRSSHASDAGAAQNVIQGMFIVGAATTATTSATSSTGVAYPVWLNYPFIKLYGDITAPTS